MLLDQILLYVPCPIFWKNLNGEFLGCNKLFLQVGNFYDYSQLIGKKDAELPWHDYATEYYKDDQHVITTGKTITRIENIPLYGRIIISETTKAPLVQDGKIIGVLGICLDITDRKEKERLQLENQTHKTEQEQQFKFKKIVDQVAHDIRSPVASLNMLIRVCTGIMEEDRIAIINAISRINDIANNLLEYFKLQQNLKEDFYSISLAKKTDLLVSADLLEILTEKRSEYSNLPISFNANFTSSGYFAFINANSQAFKRSISNLVNNAVDAITHTSAEVIIYLDANGNTVKIIIEDNGKGMPEEIIIKIMDSIAITSGKQGGYGIGLGQVRDTLAKSNAQMAIESHVGIGTKVILTFPKVQAPGWFVSQVELNLDDLVIILDDDSFIHRAWDVRFESLIPNLNCIHFEQGEQAVSFINSLTAKDKKRVFLLTDYELLNQNLTGLDVIGKTKIERSILVTNHHNNLSMRELAIANNTKILPKQLAHEVEIIVELK